MKRDNRMTVKDCLLNGNYEGLIFERSLKDDSYNGGRIYIVGNRGFDRNGAAIVEINFIDEKEPRKESMLMADILNDRLMTSRRV